MTGKRAVVLAVLLVTVISAPASAASFDSSTTATSTVVVSVGDTATEDGRAAMLAANSIADEQGLSVVHANGSSLDPAIVQTLSQRVKYGDLRNVIVVGVGDSAKQIATQLDNVGAEVGGESVTLDVKDEITADSHSDLLYRATVQQWDSASTVLLTSNTAADAKTVAVSLANDDSFDAPVLAQSSGYSQVNATLNYLDADTVVVTPGVSDDVRQDLKDDGYTVQTSVSGVSLDQPLQDVAAELASNTEDVIVTSPDKHVHTVAQTSSGAASTVLVTENSSALGAAAENRLANISNANDVYVFGDDETLTDDAFSEVSSTAQTDNTSRVAAEHGVVEGYLRASLLTTGYEYGVLTSWVTQNGENVTADLTNVGFGTIPEVDNVSVAATWSGDIESSTPAGHEDDGWVVEHHEAISPGETVTVTLQANSIENSGHPQLDYYVESGGGLLSAAGGLPFFLDQLGDLPQWLQDFLGPILPDRNIDTTNPLVIGGIVASLIVVSLGVVRAFRGGLRVVQRRRT